MDGIKFFIDTIQSIGFVGLLILLAFPATRKKLGFNDGEGQQEQIKALQEHARVANEEMGRVEVRLDRLEIKIDRTAEDTAYIRGKLDK